MTEPLAPRSPNADESGELPDAYHVERIRYLRRLAVHRCFVSRHQRERERRSTNELVRFHVRALRWLRDARRRETL